MSIDFSSVKEWTIPEGKVKSISANGVQIWSGAKPEPPVRLSWEHILWSIENNSYTTDYSIGDLIPLDLGTEGNINMQIAAFDADDRTDGNGKAHISFVSKELLNSTYAAGIYGQYPVAFGGDASAKLSSIYTNNIPLSIKSNILQVRKSATIMYLNTSIAEINSKYYVWSPSSREVFGAGNSSSGYEQSGVIYSSLFSDKQSRIKHTINLPTARAWWTRSVSSTDGNLRTVSTSGSATTTSVSKSTYVCMGFCL